MENMKYWVITCSWHYPANEAMETWLFILFDIIYYGNKPINPDLKRYCLDE